MPSVTPNRSNSSQNTAAPLSRDPTGAERQHWELNSLEDNSLFVLQISIISDCGPEARCYRRDHMRLRARAAPVFSQSSARKTAARGSTKLPRDLMAFARDEVAGDMCVADELQIFFL